MNGSHDATKLQDLLDGFIRKYVLCPECDNPETDLLVAAKKGTISQGCKACGYHGQLEVQHKVLISPIIFDEAFNMTDFLLQVNTFIIKNPPNLNPAAQGSSLTEGKRSKRSKKGEESANNSTVNLNSDADTSIVSVTEADIQVPNVVAEEVSRKHIITK